MRSLINESIEYYKHVISIVTPRDDDCGPLPVNYDGASSLTSGRLLSSEQSPLSSPEYRPSSHLYQDRAHFRHLNTDCPHYQVRAHFHRHIDHLHPPLRCFHLDTAHPHLQDHLHSPHLNIYHLHPSPNRSPSQSSPVSDEAFASEINDSYLQPLYPGASVTVCGAYCSIMQYASANKLTYTAIEELLKLLQILCPCPNSLPTTLYRFKNFFRQYNSGFEQQRVCCKCFAFLDKGETCTICVDADNPVCNPEMPGLLVCTPFQKALQTVLSSKFFQSSSLFHHSLSIVTPPLSFSLSLSLVPDPTPKGGKGLVHTELYLGLADVAFLIL